MRTINIDDEDYECFLILKKNRPQDTSRADTFHFLLTFYEEMQEFKPKPRHSNKIIVAGEETP